MRQIKRTSSFINSCILSYVNQIFRTDFSISFVVGVCVCCMVDICLIAFVVILRFFLSSFLLCVQIFGFNNNIIAVCHNGTPKFPQTNAHMLNPIHFFGRSLYKRCVRNVCMT